MPGKIPKLCRHKASGRGYVTDPYTGKEVYFTAPHGTAECQREYEGWVTKLLARRAEVASGTPAGAAGVTVARLAADYLSHARAYYVKHGRPTSEVATIVHAVDVAVELAAARDVAEFGPADLKAARTRMVERGWARGYVNRQVGRLRRMFRWGVEAELVPPAVLAGLKAVQGLGRGRTSAPEEQPVEPVERDVVEATLPHLPERLRAVVMLNLWAGMRPQDAVAMRPCDIDRSGPVWVYTPWTHKGEHRGRSRSVYLGPRCQEILAPLLKQVDADAWLFPSRGRGRSKNRGPGHLTVSGYRQAVEAAVGRANVERAGAGLAPLPRWFPLQLRHTMGTEVRRKYGLEGAQVLLGHARADVTQVYAERDTALALQIAREMG